MVCFAPRTPRVVSFGSAFLLAASLEYGGIQIQTEAFVWLLKQRQKPAPQRSPKRLNSALGKTGKEVANGVGAGEAFDAEHDMERLVRAQPVGVGEALGARDHRAQKGHEGMSRRDGVWRSQREGHGFLKFGSETDFVEKLEEAAEAAKGCDGFGGGTDLDWF